MSCDEEREILPRLPMTAKIVTQLNEMELIITYYWFWSQISDLADVNAC